MFIHCFACWISISSLILFSVPKAKTLITLPPESTTAPLNTNAIFSCAGQGTVLWQINRTQIQAAYQVEAFAAVQVYSPLPKLGYSELVVTASRRVNATLIIQCIVDPGIRQGNIKESEIVRLLVYAEPNPPLNLSILADGMNLVATWSEPFSLKGEELSYFIVITNTATMSQKEVTVNTTRYTLIEPIDRDRNCYEYQFTVFSQNSYSKSFNHVTRTKNIPTEPLTLRASDIEIEVSLRSVVSATINFDPPDPCNFYPVTSYTFNITDKATNALITSISLDTSLPLVVNGTNGHLSPNHVYTLVIEAENSVGKSLSEEIQFYTTGLQSVTVSMDLDGSITVTCVFATSAASAGCQVSFIDMDGVQEVANITRPNGVSQVFQRLSFIGARVNDTLLYIQTVEILSGESIGNVIFNTTVPLSRTPTINAARTESGHVTTPFSSVTSKASFPSIIQYVIVGGVVAVIVLVLFVMVVITSCILVSLKRRNSRDKASHEECGNRLESSSNFHAYETIAECVRESSDVMPTLHNPNYTGVLVRSNSDIPVSTCPLYAEIGQVTSNFHSRTNRTITSPTAISAAHPSPPGSFVAQSPLPYLVPQKSPNHERAKTCTQVKDRIPKGNQASHQSKKANTSQLFTDNSQRVSQDKAGICFCDQKHSGQRNHSVKSLDGSKSDNDPVYESITLKHTDTSPVPHASSGLQRASVAMQINSSYEAISHS